MGVWLILLAVKFYSDFGRKLTTKISAVTFAIFGLGFFLITIFPTNLPGSEMTLRAMIHEKTAQLICTLFPISCCLLIPEFKVNHYWKKLSRYTVIAGVIGFILVILGAVITFADAPLLGIIERLIFLNAVIWLVIISVNMMLQRRNNRNGNAATIHFLRPAHQTIR